MKNQQETLQVNRIIDAIKNVIEENRSLDGNFIGLHEPLFSGNEWNYVKECLDAGWVSSVGEYVERFENELTAYTGAKYAVAVVNGTAALHIALKLVGVRPGDEVILPTLTFVATANAVSYCGAIPHFADSEIKTLGIDPNKLEAYLLEACNVRPEGCFNKQTGRRIKALIAMHTFGHPVDIEPLVKVCQRFNLELVEDAAESLGSFYKDKHTGNFGKCSTLSFNGNKIITTGGGGAILTNDKTLANMAKHITTTAKVPHHWEYIHDQTAYNYRLPNINAALGCAQLEQIDEFVKKKRALAISYQKEISKIEGVTFFVEPKFARSNYWLNTILLNEPNTSIRNDLLETLNNKGIMTRPAWTPMHKLTMFKECPKMDLSFVENLEKRIINIPSSASLVKIPNEE
jgi:perosamine synthetase